MLQVTTAQMRSIEKQAVESGLGFLRLMENAGSAAAKLIRTHYAIAGKPVVILCGKGNNGGDGFVIARKLRDEGALVTVILTSGSPKSENALEMMSRIQNTEIVYVDLEKEPFVASDSIQKASLIVDSVYGIGFHGSIPDSLRSLFRQINACTVPVISIDAPSGLNSDSGDVDQDTLQASMTITFTALKVGLNSIDAKKVCGDIQVAAIGIDPSILEPYAGSEQIIHMDWVKKCFQERPSDSNKGDFGRLLTLCGSRGMVGAAVMSIKAALRCGAGLVVSALPQSLYPIAAAQISEPVFCLLDENNNGDFSLTARSEVREQLKRASAVLIGCGMGTSAGAQAVMMDCLIKAKSPIVLDADGINLLSGHINILKTVNAPLVLTPHPGEMARLMGISIDEIQSHRQETARKFADEYGVTLVLKGHNTIVASPNQPLRINKTGNPGMSTGGSGDVLAGMIASFLAQGMTPHEAAVCGVYLHGQAGDNAAARLSQHAMLPTDMIEELGGLFLILENRS